MNTGVKVALAIAAVAIVAITAGMLLGIFPNFDHQDIEQPTGSYDDTTIKNNDLKPGDTIVFTDTDGKDIEIKIMGGSNTEGGVEILHDGKSIKGRWTSDTDGNLEVTTAEGTKTYPYKDTKYLGFRTKITQGLSDYEYLQQYGIYYNASKGILIKEGILQTGWGPRDCFYISFVPNYDPSKAPEASWFEMGSDQLECIMDIDYPITWYRDGILLKASSAIVEETEQKTVLQPVMKAGDYILYQYTDNYGDTSYGYYSAEKVDGRILIETHRQRDCDIETVHGLQCEPWTDQEIKRINDDQRTSECYDNYYVKQGIIRTDGGDFKVITEDFWDAVHYEQVSWQSEYKDQSRNDMIENYDPEHNVWFIGVDFDDYTRYTNYKLVTEIDYDSPYGKRACFVVFTAKYNVYTFGDEIKEEWIHNNRCIIDKYLGIIWEKSEYRNNKLRNTEKLEGASFLDEYFGMKNTTSEEIIKNTVFKDETVSFIEGKEVTWSFSGEAILNNGKNIYTEQITDNGTISLKVKKVDGRKTTLNLQIHSELIDFDSDFDVLTDMKNRLTRLNFIHEDGNNGIYVDVEIRGSGVNPGCVFIGNKITGTELDMSIKDNYRIEEGYSFRLSPVMKIDDGHIHRGNSYYRIGSWETVSGSLNDLFA